MAKIFENAPNDMKFSHIVRMDKTNTQKKWESIMTKFFEGFREFWNLQSSAVIVTKP